MRGGSDPPVPGCRCGAARGVPTLFLWGPLDRAVDGARAERLHRGPLPGRHQRQLQVGAWRHVDEEALAVLLPASRCRLAGRCLLGLARRCLLQRGGEWWRGWPGRLLACGGEVAPLRLAHRAPPWRSPWLSARRRAIASRAPGGSVRRRRFSAVIIVPRSVASVVAGGFGDSARAVATVSGHLASRPALVAASRPPCVLGRFGLCRSPPRWAPPRVRRRPAARTRGAVMPWVNACWWSMRSWRMTGTPRPRTAGAPLRLVVLAGVDPRPVQHDGGWLQREARDVQRCRWRASLGRGRPARTGRLRRPQPVACPPCVAAVDHGLERRDPLGVPADGVCFRSTASSAHPKGPSIKAASPGWKPYAWGRPPVGVGLPWQHGRSRLRHVAVTALTSPCPRRARGQTGPELLDQILVVGPRPAGVDDVAAADDCGVG